MKIDMPEVLVSLRAQITRGKQQTLGGRFGVWNLGMYAAARIFASGDRLALAQALVRLGQRPFISSKGSIEHLPPPLSGWTSALELPSQRVCARYNRVIEATAQLGRSIPRRVSSCSRSQFTITALRSSVRCR